jgi:hypothetical protein
MLLTAQLRPGFLLNAFANDAYLDGLVQCKQQGLADAVRASREQFS